MPDLSFEVAGAEPLPFAASPVLIFKLRIGAGDADSAAMPIQAITLACQIRIEPGRRRYGAEEGERLLDVFGERERWPETQRGMLWTHASAVVPPFAGSTVVDLPVPCTADFNMAAARYFHALEDGEVPLLLLFSGSVFHETADRGLQVCRIPWEKEASFRMPVRVWKEMMDHYYPQAAWLCLRKDALERLSRWKRRRAVPTFEDALGRLLEAAGETVSSPPGPPEGASSSPPGPPEGASP
jgi:hypothetical protein